MSDDKEITSEESTEQSEKNLERKLTKAELRLKGRIEKFFEANEGRDVVDVVGELFTRIEDVEETIISLSKNEKDDWNRGGREL